MPVNLSIRNVPDDIAARLRARAKQNHRSLQGELMAIFAEATNERGAPGMQDGQREYRAEQPAPQMRKLTVDDLAERAKARRMHEIGGETGAQMVRRDRDEGHVKSRQPLDAVEALKQMRSLGVRTKDEVVQMIRDDRDR